MRLPEGVDAIERAYPSGSYAEVFLVRAGGRRSILKVARREVLPPSATKPLFAATGLAFMTGSLASFRPTPNDVLEAELAVLRGPGGPELVQVEREGTLDGRRWLLLAFAAGPNLREQPATLEEIRLLARQVARLEALGVRHGDLKPENVVRDAGRLVLCDPTSGVTLAGEVRAMLATPAYNPLFAASDVPALSLMLAEVFAGEPLASRRGAPLPLAPSAEHWRGTMTRLGSGALADALLTLPRPRDLAPSMPPELEELVWAGLGLAERGGRFEIVPPLPTVAELARRLG